MALRFGVRAAGSLELPFTAIHREDTGKRKFWGGVGENSTVKILDKVIGNITRNLNADVEYQCCINAVI